MSRGGSAYRRCCRRISHTKRDVATSACSKTSLVSSTESGAVAAAVTLSSAASVWHACAARV